jgi:hypothetical protein
MDWKTVAEKIVQDDQNKWDQTYLAEELEVAEVGPGVWPFSDHAARHPRKETVLPAQNLTALLLVR